MPVSRRPLLNCLLILCGLGWVSGTAELGSAQTGRRFVPILPDSAADGNATPNGSIFRQETGQAPTGQPGLGNRQFLMLGQDPLPPTQAYPPASYGTPPNGFSAGYPPQTVAPAAPSTYTPTPFPQQGGAYGVPPAGTTGLPGGDLGIYQSTPGNTGSGANFADLDVYVTEGQTGKFLFGGAYNSDAGVTGQIIIDERNFDLLRFPRSFRDVIEGRAFRGGGQRFRMELVPGSRVQRYMVSLTEPYLLDSNVSLRVSGYFFNRNYFDWDEERLGGEIQLGYRLTPDLSLGVSVRAENIDVSNPRLNTSPQLNSVLGDTDLYVGRFTLTHDTRDHPFLPTEGRYMEIGLSQGFGEYDFGRADLDMRKYFLLYQRPDRSGRHTLSVGTRLGFSGTDTPIMENYFAGGFSTMRGFDFRGASPVEGGVIVGGRFQWLNTVEYTFPLTADDMVKGVAFVDYGTVEQNVTLDADSFRVAPGLGLRIHMPAAGAGGAPLAFDFAVPLMRDETDDTKIFSFYLGFIR